MANYLQATLCAVMVAMIHTPALPIMQTEYS